MTAVSAAARDDLVMAEEAPSTTAAPTCFATSRQRGGRRFKGGAPGRATRSAGADDGGGAGHAPVRSDVELEGAGNVTDVAVVVGGSAPVRGALNVLPRSYGEAHVIGDTLADVRRAAGGASAVEVGA